MKVEPRPNYEGTFDWVEDGKVVASITLYDEGLVEFGSKQIEIAVECIGTEDEQVAINKDNHVTTVDQDTITVARPKNGLKIGQG